MNFDKFPPISKQLLEALDEAFPSRDPDPSQPLAAIMYYSGGRNVVRYLHDVMSMQSNNLTDPRMF